MTETTHDASAKIDSHPIMVVVRFGMLVLLAAFFVFAHGCHGDEDNELFACAVRVILSAN